MEKKPTTFYQAIRVDEPTTAYDVIGHLMEVITKDPQVFYMNTWGSPLSDQRMSVSTVKTSTGRSCGTAACAAGWTHIILGGRRSDDNSIGHNAARILVGLPPLSPGETYDDAFEGGTFVQARAASDLYNQIFTNDDLIGWGGDNPRGTPEHAARVVAALEEFRKKYKRLLRRVIVKPHGNGVNGAKVCVADAPL